MDAVFETVRLVGREDHLVDDRKPLLFEEHVLGAAKANTLRAILSRALGVSRIIGVCPHLEPADAVRPAENLTELALLREARRDSLDLSLEHLAGAAIQGNLVPLGNYFSVGGHR